MNKAQHINKSKNELRTKRAKYFQFTMIDNDTRTRIVKDINGNAYAVYCELITHYNVKTGLCCPSMDFLVEKTGMGKGTIDRALKALKEKGWIDWESVKSSNGFKNNHYIFSYPMDKLTADGVDAVQIIKNKEAVEEPQEASEVVVKKPEKLLTMQETQNMSTEQISADLEIQSLSTENMALKRSIERISLELGKALNTIDNLKKDYILLQESNKEWVEYCCSLENYIEAMTGKSICEIPHAK